MKTPSCAGTKYIDMCTGNQGAGIKHVDIVGTHPLSTQNFLSFASVTTFSTFVLVFSPFNIKYSFVYPFTVFVYPLDLLVITVGVRRSLFMVGCLIGSRSSALIRCPSSLFCWFMTYSLSFVIFFGLSNLFAVMNSCHVIFRSVPLFNIMLILSYDSWFDILE